MSESQRRGEVDLAPQANALDREIARQRALAVDYHDAGDAEDRAADRLEMFRAFLDTEFPDWPDRLEKQK